MVYVQLRYLCGLRRYRESRLFRQVNTLIDKRRQNSFKISHCPIIIKKIYYILQELLDIKFPIVYNMVEG